MSNHKSGKLMIVILVLIVFGIFLILNNSIQQNNQLNIKNLNENIQIYDSNNGEQIQLNPSSKQKTPKKIDVKITDSKNTISFDDIQLTSINQANKPELITTNLLKQKIEQKTERVVNDFIWVESNNFVPKDTGGKIILSSIGQKTFKCDGTVDNPDCFEITTCATSEKPCYEFEAGKTIVYVNHFSGAFNTMTWTTDADWNSGTHTNSTNQTDDLIISGTNITGTYLSNTTDATYPIIRIKPIWNSTEQDTNKNITVEVSADAGATWIQTTNNTNYTSGASIGSGTELVFRINFSTNDSAISPELHDITVEYGTDTPPTIDFVAPTDDNNKYITNNYTYINVTVTDDTNTTAFIDWNNSLVGWWRFNNETGENNTFFRDWSSYGNNASCSGITCPILSNGMFGMSITTDGNDDWVNFPATSISNILKTSGVGTISLWAYYDGSNSNYLLSLSRPNVHRDYFSYNMGGTGIISIIFSVSDAYRMYGATTVNAKANSWNHIVFIQDGIYPKIYINGQDANLVLNPSVVPNAYTPGYWFDDYGTFTYMGLGRFHWYDTAPSNGNAYYNSKIDEFRLYTRILPPEEINASYNAGLYRLETNITNLNDGTYTYTAYAQDLAGNINNTETRTLTIMQPTNNAYVDDDGICASNTPCFTTIQNAINVESVNSGATIYVYNGTYTEQVIVNKTVILEGESNDGTKLVGGFNVTQNDTTITNFNITGGYLFNTRNKAGIYTTSSNNIFKVNKITNIIALVGSASGAGTPGGTVSAIYLSSSTLNNIYLNIISDLTGGAGGSAGYASTGSQGGIASAIYLSSSTLNNISLNIISDLTGGSGGTGGFIGSGGTGGIASAIYLISSTLNNINSNIISSLNAGAPGIAGGGGSGAGMSGVTIAIFLNTNSYNNEITPLTLQGSYYIPNQLNINVIDGKPILYFYNKTNLNISDFNITTSTIPIFSGTISSGIILINVNDSLIERNIVSGFGSIPGSSGIYHKPGSSGRKTSAIYLSSSMSNNLTSNIISNLKGGSGGTGGLSYYGGVGGTVSAIYIESSTLNNITSNNISSLTIGAGGLGGAGGGLMGASGVTIAMFLDTNSYDNDLTVLTTQGAYNIPNQSNLNIIDRAPILYFYNKTNLNISDFNITTSTIPILMETTSSGITLINVNDSLIERNIVSGFSSLSGVSGSTGGAGATSTAIYLSASISNNLNSNNIFSLTGGVGGTGKTDSVGGDGGVGGNIYSFYLLFSTNNNLSLNSISNITGGLGGFGSTNGAPGTSTNYYFTSSDTNNIINSNLTETTSDYDIYSITDSVNNLINSSFNISKFNILDTSILNVQWYLDVYVNNTFGTQIENVTVTATQNSGTQAFTKNTTSTGYISQNILTEFVITSSGTDYSTYVNYTINASKTNYSTISKEINLTKSLEIYFTLSDMTPPTIDIISPINNHAYVSDSIDFAIVVYAPESNIAWCGYSINDSNYSVIDPRSGDEYGVILNNLKTGIYNVTFSCNNTLGLSTSEIVYYNISPAHVIIRLESESIIPVTDNTNKYVVSTLSQNRLTGLIHAKGTFYDISSDSNHMSLTNKIGSKTYLVYTEAEINDIETRTKYIKSGEFEKMPNPSFGFPIANKNTVYVGIEYDDIDLDGNELIHDGFFTFIFRNAGERTNKHIIDVKRK